MLAALILQLYCGRNPIYCECKSVVILLLLYLRYLPPGLGLRRERKESCFWFCRRSSFELLISYLCLYIIAWDSDPSVLRTLYGPSSDVHCEAPAAGNAEVWSSRHHGISPRILDNTEQAADSHRDYTCCWWFQLTFVSELWFAHSSGVAVGSSGIIRNYRCVYVCVCAWRAWKYAHDSVNLNQMVVLSDV